MDERSTSRSPKSGSFVINRHGWKVFVLISPHFYLPFWILAKHSRARVDLPKESATLSFESGLNQRDEATQGDETPLSK